MPTISINREIGLDTIAIDNACEAIRNGATLAQAAVALNIPWQRLLFIARDRGVIRPNGRAVCCRRSTSGRCAAVVNNDAVTYGVEIECYLPTGSDWSGLPEGWTIKYDGSLQSTPSGYIGREVVSPILTGETGVAQIVAVCRWLNDRNAKVNKTCGFHVHVGWKGNRAQLSRLVNLVAKNEKALYAVSGTKSREQGYYCKSIRNLRYMEIANGTAAVCSTLRTHDDRYHSLNLRNLRQGGTGTVEFRVFSGTTNATKILTYVAIALGHVAKACDNDEAIEAGFEGTEARNGCQAVAEMLAGLGWGFAKNHGIIATEAAPTPIAMAFEMGRLAQRYDGPEVAEVAA